MQIYDYHLAIQGHCTCLMHIKFTQKGHEPKKTPSQP